MEIDIYSDETFILDKKYMGIGCLFVPRDKKPDLNEYLTNLRCLDPSSKEYVWNFNECPHKCRENYHKNNNCEIHYNKLTKNASHSKREISKKWIKLLINNNRKNMGMIYFKILYIDLDKLDKCFFGNEHVEDNIYNRFYRTIIQKGCKYFFGSGVDICTIFHDESDNKECHDYFGWHTLHKLDIDDHNINTKTNEIVFLDSNHRNYFNNDRTKIMESQFIQFIDLILGVTSQLLFETSEDIEKIELSTIMYELVKRLIENPRNKNSSFHYFKKQEIDIFPKYNISYSKDLHGKIVRDKGEFHRNIKVKKPNIPSNNETLDRWFEF